MVRSLESFVRQHSAAVRSLIVEKLKIDPGLNGITVDLPAKRPRKRLIMKDKSYRSKVNTRLLRWKNTRKRQVSTRSLKVPSLSESTDDSSNKLFTIKEILFESFDQKRRKTMGRALFVGYGVKKAAWVNLDEMTPKARAWWVDEKRKRFPTPYR